MELNERISLVVKHSRLTKSEFTRRLGLKTTAGVFQLINGKTKSLSHEMKTKILESYPEINQEWLETGEGEMLKTNYTQNVYGDGQTTQTGDIHNADCEALMRAMDEITEMRKSFSQALERKDEQISRLIALLENIAPSKK